MQKYRILPTLQKKAWFNFPNMKKRVTFALGFADMAQLVEQRIRNAWVRGSSPLIGSKKISRELFPEFSFFTGLTGRFLICLSYFRLQERTEI